MYPIRDIAETVAAPALETLEGDARQEHLNKVDKALRNLSQRVYLPPAGRSGRADLYSREGACALLLVHALFNTGFAVSRATLESFARWMQQPNADPAAMVVGGKRLVPIAEGIQRAASGEVFDFRIVSAGEFGFRHLATWDLPGAARGKAALDAAIAAGLAPEPTSVSLTVPASALIREFLAKLDG